MRGRGVNSSYTFALTFHLRNHSTEWQNFLDNLTSQIVPDDKTNYEHFKQMEAPKAYSKEESNNRFDESNICRNLIEENIAVLHTSSGIESFFKTCSTNLLNA